MTKVQREKCVELTKAGYVVDTLENLNFLDYVPMSFGRTKVHVKFDGTVEKAA